MTNDQATAEITEGGQSTQFSERQVPWMKLGKLVDQPVTAKEAAMMSGLNFTVALHDVYFGTCVGSDCQDQFPTKIMNRKAVVREDTLEPLAIVSSGYPVLQYHEAFDFMDQVSTRYVAAGALKGGKQGYMVVEAPDGISLDVLDGQDPHKLYAVLRTSHDLTRAVEVMVMPLRGRCMNQLTLKSFTAGVDHRWRAPHTTTMHSKLQEAMISLKKLETYAEHFNTLAKRLAGIKINDEQAKFVLSKVISNRPKKDEVVELIIAKMHSSPTVGWDGTGWGLVNSVSEYYDWGRQGGSPESRFVAALQGQTHTAINRTAGLVLSRFGATK